MKTTAAILFEPNKPLEILQLELPPLAEGQVLVKVAYSGICRSQLMEVQGKRGPDKYLPHLLGHEGSGEVMEVGPGVKKVKPHDYVVLTWIKGTGMDVAGPQYRYGRRTINAGPITTFCTYTVVSENRCVRIPRNTPLDIAALFGCALPTGAGIVQHELRPAAGATTAVFGVGGVGLSAVIALGLENCSIIVAVDRDPYKLSMATKMGATNTIDCRTEDAIKAIEGLTHGRGVDCSVDATGTTKGIETAFCVIRKAGGLSVFASHPPNGERIRLDPHALICGKQIRGSWGGATRPDADIPRLLRRCLAERIPLTQMITHRYALSEVNEGMRTLERGHACRVLLCFNAPSSKGCA